MPASGASTFTYKVTEGCPVTSKESSRGLRVDNKVMCVLLLPRVCNDMIQDVVLYEIPTRNHSTSRRRVHIPRSVSKSGEVGHGLLFHRNLLFHRPCGCVLIDTTGKRQTRSRLNVEAHVAMWWRPHVARLFPCLLTNGKVVHREGVKIITFREESHQL